MRYSSNKIRVCTRIFASNDKHLSVLIKLKTTHRVQNLRNKLIKKIFMVSLAVKKNLVYVLGERESDVPSPSACPFLKLGSNMRHMLMFNPYNEY